MTNNERYPLSPDVAERETLDGGFSKGWGFHFKPVPAYAFDCHVHYMGNPMKLFADCTAASLAEAVTLGVPRALMIFQIYDKARGRKADGLMDTFPWFTLDEAKARMADYNTESLPWSAYISYRDPDAALVNAIADAGAVCMKLHNAAVIMDNAPHDVWLSPEWDAAFEAMGKRKLPILFHVTQRLSASAYTGAGRNSYWKVGWPNGVTYTNEDLLQSFLAVCKRHPNVNFIGAHQLHVGWERLDALLTEYPNLNIDTTVGCTLKPWDDFYPPDAEYLRNFFLKWQDRLLFGTDAFWSESPLQADVYQLHLRFLNKLDLTQEALDKVYHSNLERLCGLSALM